MLLLAMTVGTWAQNTLPGKFSVSDTKQVYFSKGNLQYVGTTWQFAEHQYDYFGSDQYEGHQDLFPSSGYGSPNEDESWYTLSQPEWEYLYIGRSVRNTLSEGARFIRVTIDGKYRGSIIFPDDYTHPDNTDFAGSMFNHEGSDDYTATVSLEGWEKMEAAGCLFLPAAGYNTNSSSYGNHGLYNSTTPESGSSRYTPGWYLSGLALKDWSYNNTRVPVRLVRDDEDPDGIKSPTLSPERETVNGKWFDLQGRQHSGKPARGIYIENRQKKVK
jgi:hypothetical protein